MLFDVNFKDLLDIFATINTYAVVLNTQEKLNARYLGVFKTYVYELGRDVADVVTRKQVSKMGEAQLSSDLLILCNGVQTVKNIEKFYRKYEVSENVPDELRDGKRNFHTAMATIGELYPAEDLKNTNWSRSHLFYTLFSAVARAPCAVGGLPPEVRPPINDARQKRHWRSVLNEISAQYDLYTGDGTTGIPADYARFIDYARRRTTRPRLVSRGQSSFSGKLAQGRSCRQSLTFSSLKPSSKENTWTTGSPQANSVGRS